MNTDSDPSTSLIRVLGLGNVLCGDDAFGPYVVRLLEAEYELCEAVEVLDLGTPGLDLTPYLADARAVIIADTVHANGPAGSVHTYDRQQLLAMPVLPRTNPHEPGLAEALATTEMAGTSPAEVLLIGVVPQSTETGTGMTPPVQRAAAAVVAAVVRELTRLGYPPKRRHNPHRPDIWWEETAPS